MPHQATPAPVITVQANHVDLEFTDEVSTRQLRRIHKRLANARFIASAKRFKKVIMADLKITTSVDEIFDLIIGVLNKTLNTVKPLTSLLTPGPKAQVLISSNSGTVASRQASFGKPQRTVHPRRRPPRSKRIRQDI